FFWSFYDGGSRENVTALGELPRTKNSSPLPPTTMFELVEAFDLVSQAKLWSWNHCGITGEEMMGGNK
ncbi:MAG: hypothetical protein ACE3L7_12835, partial [Candidatus Pristimantibacillus sp.]